MPVFFVCAGLLGLIAIVLGLNVARTRGRKKISLGDGGDPEMLAAVRAHANLVEWAPLGLLLIYFVSDFYGYWTVAGLSAVLLAARVLHAGGMFRTIPMGRTLGASGTVLRLEGGRWIRDYATGLNVNAVTGTAGGDVWAVGETSRASASAARCAISSWPSAVGWTASGKSRRQPRKSSRSTTTVLSRAAAAARTIALSSPTLAPAGGRPRSSGTVATQIRAARSVSPPRIRSSAAVNAPGSQSSARTSLVPAPTQASA